MNGITERGGSTEHVRGVPLPSQIDQIEWRVIEGASQRMVVCSMRSRTTGIEVRVGYRDNAVMRTQLAFDADAARALAHMWLQALRAYGSLAVFMAETVEDSIADKLRNSGEPLSGRRDA
jgi:hypothetical protein